MWTVLGADLGAHLGVFPAMPIHQVKSRSDGSVLFEGEFETFADAVVRAIKSEKMLCGSDLRGSDLRGADLSGADLRGVLLSEALLSGDDLSGADLRGADLCGADLRWALLSGALLSGSDLRGADLSGALLSGANLRWALLRGADLCGADMCGADLRGADLCGADLNGAKINWQSHDLVAEILMKSSGDDLERRKVAGLVAISRDWCWDQFLALRSDPLFEWAIDTLAVYVTAGDDAPKILADRAKQQSEKNLGQEK